MKTLMLLLLLVPSVCWADGFHLAIGLGIHDPSSDWHLHSSDFTYKDQHYTFAPKDPYETNPLGIIRASYKIQRWEFGLEHISSIPNHSDDKGLTMAYVLVDIY